MKRPFKVLTERIYANSYKRTMTRSVVFFSMAFLVFVGHGPAFALDCPKMPEQINKNWEVEVSATIAKIGPVKGGELRTRTSNATKDLLSKLPDAGRVYLEQMMYCAYCSALRDDKTIKESEKAKLLMEYNREVRKTITTSPASVPKPALKPTKNQSKGETPPNARKIALTYGLSEKIVNEWIEQLKGKDKVIESLLEDLKGKNVTLKIMEVQIQDGITMYKELERRLAERPSDNVVSAQASKKIDPLIKFTHQEFIDNFIAFRAYYQYRKTLQLLNSDMLIELLNIYFRSVLLYPSNDMKKYYVTASDGKLLLLQIEGHNEKGEKTSISLPDISNSLLKDVCTDFVKSANPQHYEMLIYLFDRALSTLELDKVHKYNILDAKNMILKNKLFRNMGNTSESIISQ